MGDVSTDGGLTHANIDDIGIGCRDGNGTDRGPLEKAIGDILPVHTAIARFPDAASRRPEVKHLSMGRIACHCYDASAAIWTNRAPLERGQ